MATINFIHASWILDSRGVPTVSVNLGIEQNGRKVIETAAVPSGASTGIHEALELRDGEKDFFGKGVEKAIFNVNETILNRLHYREFTTAAEIDEILIELDGTENFSSLGANAALAVSMAAHRAFANLAGLELWQYLRRIYFSYYPVKSRFPKLMCNVINGGAHADNGLQIQEFMIVPNTRNLLTDVQLSSEVYHNLKLILKEKGFSTGVGDEGGFAPAISESRKVLTLINEAIEKAGYTKLDCNLALDVAASELFNTETEKYSIDKQTFTRAELTEFYADLAEEFNLISIEDGFAEDDVLGWQMLTKKIGAKRMLVGDDLFVTNSKRLEEIGIKQEAGNAILIKPNQIGTILQTCKTIELAKVNNFATIISHRSGETSDTFIADLAIASQSEFIKLGAPCRGERVAKYNRLLEIQQQIEG